MTHIRKKLALCLAIAWAILLSVVTALTLPSQFMDADVAMHSIMSLQNVTLFFWGQNRLANVLPLAVSWITDPTANLVAVLVLAALCFYLLLFAFSRLAAAAVDRSRIDALSLETFVVLSAVVAVCFTPATICEIAVTHFEYALPALCLVVAAHFSILRTGEAPPRALATAAACVIATGVNPAILIPGLFICAGAVLFRKRVGLAEIILSASLVLSFVGWGLAAESRGSSAYHSFDATILQAGMRTVIGGLVARLNLPAVTLLFGGLLLAKGVAGRYKSPDPGAGGVSSLLCHVTAAFVLAWLLLFSGNHWVQQNQFSWRYFIFVFFAGLFWLAISIAGLMAPLRQWHSRAVTAVAATVWLVAGFSLPTGFGNYALFRAVDSHARPGVHLYSGDYWLVWPSVLRDMMRGNEAYGLAIRGEGNRAGARDFVARQIQRHGDVPVLCLEAAPAECRRQIETVVGPVAVSEVTRLSEHVHQMRLSGMLDRLQYQGAAFLALPSAVGVTDQGMKRSDGREGFLLFGPYAALDAGNYRFDVFGAAQQLDGAYVEVVSAGGERKLARFALEAGTDGRVVRNAGVRLPVDVQGLEVRVWVRGGSQVQLTGYRLSRE